MEALKLSHLIATGISLLYLSISLAYAQADNKATNLSDSEKQRQELSENYGITIGQAALVQKFSYSRTRQIDSLSRLNLPTEEFRDKREALTNTTGRFSRFSRPNSRSSSTSTHSRQQEQER